MKIDLKIVWPKKNILLKIFSTYKLYKRVSFQYFHGCIQCTLNNFTPSNILFTHFCTPPFFKKYLVDFIMLSSCVCVTYFDSAHLTVYSAPSYWSLQTVLPLHSWPIVVIVIIIILLGLDSTCERKYATLGILTLASLLQNDDLQSHPFSWKTT
jgi:hypothetical protein